ncbi:MAG: hypothetical protein ORN26_00510 [Candidatus Pacebacteria bacterium]|nr:hypothetical protein [Candidatus Paceibacterota bacterium]
MGPSQFIASTWNIYSSRIASFTGAGIANPWNANHAITATAIYLQDLGARAFNTASEKRAACKYYGTGGATCSYGNQVLAKVANIQSDIDTIEKGLATR